MHINSLVKILMTSYLQTSLQWNKMSFYRIMIHNQTCAQNEQCTTQYTHGEENYGAVNCLKQ